MGPQLVARLAGERVPLLVFVHDIFATIPTHGGPAATSIQVRLQLVEWHLQLTEVALN